MMAGWPTDAEIAYFVTRSGTEFTDADERCLGLADALKAEASRFLGFHTVTEGSSETVVIRGFKDARDFYSSKRLDLQDAWRSVSALTVYDQEGNLIYTAEDNDYWLDTGVDGWSSRLDIYAYIGVNPHRFHVTGVRGRFASDAVPEDVRRAVCAYGAAKVVSDAAIQYGDGLKSWESGPFKESFDATVAHQATEQAEQVFKKVLARYRRVAV